MAETLTVPLASGRGTSTAGTAAVDVEEASDGATPSEEQPLTFSSFMSRAAGSLQESVTKGVDRAKSLDWGQVTEGATAAAASFQERVSSGVETAKNSETWSSARERMVSGWKAISERTSTATADLSERLSDNNVVQNARGAVTTAASSTSSAITNVGDTVQSAALVATDPEVMKRFFVLFGVGSVLCGLSFFFVPWLFLAPRMFSLVFTLGSGALLGSFFVLRGMAFAMVVIEPKRLPFTATYVLGVLAALWATVAKPKKLGMPSFVAIFGTVCQVIALTYFICSFFPGGVSTLNALRSAGSRTLSRVLDG